MEYAAYLRIVPFAAQNYAANTPALHGTFKTSILLSIADTGGILQFYSFAVLWLVISLCSMLHQYTIIICMIVMKKSQEVSLRSPNFINNSQSLFIILFLGHPELLSILHDISQHRSTQKHHMFTTRRIFNVDFEFLHSCFITS